MNISFILPEDNRSGGVRVTAIMAALLTERGHSVRIILTDTKKSLFKKTKRFAKNLRSMGNDGWLHLFGGTVVKEANLNNLEYASNEVVIAVGTYTVDSLWELNAPVIKLRYNHGLPAIFDERAQRCWSYNLPSITVSNTILPKLNELAPDTCLGVVPNGIDSSLYYNLNRERDGIGVFYSTHPNKAPDFMVEILKRINEERPEIPIHMVSTHQKPAELKFTKFYNLPSVEKLNEIYNTCKIWLLPSDTEGLPGPVLEALSCGTAIVTTDNDGSLEIVEKNVNGFVTPKRDLEGFLETVYQAFDDDDLRDKIARAGAERAKEFTWERAVEKMELILERLASGVK